MPSSSSKTSLVVPPARARKRRKHEAWLATRSFRRSSASCSSTYRRRSRFAPGTDVRELALTKYADKVRERVREGITAAVASKQHPLLPVTNRFQPFVTTSDVEDQTTRPIVRLTKSHLNAAIVLSGAETKAGEVEAIDILEDLDSVECFTPNSRKIGIQIPYRYEDAPARYEPDFVVRLRGGKMLVLEIKGEGGLIHGDNRDKTEAKKTGTRKWIDAVNNAKRYGYVGIRVLR